MLHPEFQISVPEMDVGFRDWLPGSGCETSVFMFERKWGESPPSLWQALGSEVIEDNEGVADPASSRDISVPLAMLAAKTPGLVTDKSGRV